MSKQDYTEALNSLQAVGIRLTPKGDAEWPRNHFWQDIGQDLLATIALHKSDVATSVSSPHRHWFGLREPDLRAVAPPDRIILWAKKEQHAFAIPGKELSEFFLQLETAGEGKVENGQWHVDVDFAPLTVASILPVNARSRLYLAPYCLNLGPNA